MIASYLRMTFTESSHKTRNLPIVLRVDIGAGGVKQLNDVQVTPVGRKPKTRVALLVSHVDLRLARKEKLDKAIVALVGGDRQRRVSARRHGRGVHVGALVQEHATDFHVASGGGLHQRREPRFGSMFHIGSSVQKQRDNLVSALRYKT